MHLHRCQAFCCIVGLLFVPPGHGLSPEGTRETHLFLSFVAGNMLVNLRLDGLGGSKAHFNVN
jgi:hypothetical protein